MATMDDVLMALKYHPNGALSCTVALALWPTGSQTKGGGKDWNRPHHGGPTGGQRAAAGMLGKLARRGLVFPKAKDGDPRSYWKLTDAGRLAVHGMTPNGPR